MTRKVLLAVVVVLVGGCAPVSPAPGGGAAPPSPVIVRVAATSSAESHLRVGATHTQFSADSWHDPSAVSSAIETLRDTVRYQNQHIMGFGATNPEPAPGKFDFTSLDRRIELVRRSGGTPVITLCCSPDWMKGGEPEQTDWSLINVAPTPDHYADFAQLAATVAERYPEVRYFQVWNEMKGFYSEARNRWNAEGYTELYNDVYRAVKAVRPDARLGGPYVKVESFVDAASQSQPSTVTGPWGVLDQRSLDVIDYWLVNKAGADFVTVDATTAARDEQLVTNEFDSTAKFSAVDAWLRARTSLPIWWAEWPVQPEHSSWDEQHIDAVLTTALGQIAGSDASLALLWQPQGVGESCRGCLWTDTARHDGGRPSRLATSLRAFARAFPPDTPVLAATSTSADVSAFASPDTVVLVNRTPISRTVSLDGRSITLRRYGVRYVRRAGEPRRARVTCSAGCSDCNGRGSRGPTRP